MSDTVAVLPREWVWILWHYHGIGFEICGNPMGMGTRLAVLPRFWGWVYMDCELMHELGTVYLQTKLSVD